MSPFFHACRGPVGQQQYRSKIKAKLGEHRLGLACARETRICLNHRQRIGVGVASRFDRRQNGCRLNFASVKLFICSEPDCARLCIAGPPAPFYAEEEKMAEILRQRWIPKRHTRQSVHPDTQAGEFTIILTFSLSGLALFLFAIGQGWLGDAGYVTGLFLLLQ
jgi:hypothetical protein